ncbi:unnamed protein product [Paramecium sonneborni]|uniref:Uncharacterized protein n=1 Tax=Paramecium sonneborni TaxID=65129 RepID=A0A8S1K0L2_9CILI|nr:unnamed protein product [Paramecium sonneborni]
MQQIQIQTATQDKAAYNRNAQKIIDKLKANDVDFIDATLEYSLQVFTSNEPPLRKLLLLRLIKDAIVIKSAKFINKYIQSRPLLTFIGNICTHKLGDSNPNRGADLFQGQDPQSSIDFLNLALELVEYLANTFPKDSKGAPTKFKIQYDELLQMGVKFPPQSSLILPFDPNKASQEPIQKQSDNKGERDKTMLELNKSKQSIYQDIQMINESLVDNSDMTYINEVLVTYSESMNQVEQSFTILINKAQQYDGVLNEDELAELYALKDFVEKFQKYYYGYLEGECTNEAYNALKKKTLAHIQKIQNKDFDYPPPQQQLKKQSQLQQINQYQYQDEDEQFKRAIEESKIQQQSSQLASKQLEEQKKQEQIKRQYEEDQRQAKLREEQAALQRLKAEEERRDKEKLEQIKQEQLRLEEKKKEQLRLEQIKQEKIRLEAQQLQQQQLKEKEIENYWQNQFQAPHPDNQYMPSSKFGSNVNPQQYQFSQFQQQQQYQSNIQSSLQQQKYDQQQNGNFNNEYIYSNVDQQKQQKQPVKQTNQFEQTYNNSQVQNQNYQYGGNTREQFPMNHISSNIMQKKEFDENFDGLSQSTQTQQFYPLKMNQQIPIKQYTGKFVKYDNFQFELLHKYGLSESQKKRFKIATITGKASLFNSPQLQVGIKQTLQYVPLKEKNYLKLTLYIGNKTQSNFDNCKMLFEGDNRQFSMWLKPDRIAERIQAGQQIQQEVIGIFKQYENYRLINVVFQAEWANKQISSQFFLTTTLVSFMDFKDISLQIFRTKWRLKKQQILRGETFLLNPKIVKTGHYLKKIFPKLCEFNSYQQFQDQQLDYFSDRQMKYISYKLCGVFELTNVNQNYMIKFIVLPNMQCTIQIIGSNEHLCKQMLNTLNWILGLE